MNIVNPYELLTADEVFEEFTKEAKFLNWNSRNLPVLFKTKNLNGGWNNNIKCYEYTRESIIYCIQHAKGNLQRQLEWLNNPFKKR